MTHTGKGVTGNCHALSCPAEEQGGHSGRLHWKTCRPLTRQASLHQPSLGPVPVLALLTLLLPAGTTLARLRLLFFAVGL